LYVLVVSYNTKTLLIYVANDIILLSSCIREIYRVYLQGILVGNKYNYGKMNKVDENCLHL